MMTEREELIEDFLSGDFIKSFADGETRKYEFDKNSISVVTKNDFSGNPGNVLRYRVRDVGSNIDSWKTWDLSRAHRNVYQELKEGNNGKGWTVMEITRHGLLKKTQYSCKGVR